MSGRGWGAWVLVFFVALGGCQGMERPPNDPPETTSPVPKEKVTRDPNAPDQEATPLENPHPYRVLDVFNEAARARFWASPSDPASEFLDAVSPDLAGRHYLSCDEYQLDFFYKHIQGLGGGYMGVGTDQAYLFIGWQRPDLAWLTDYDDHVVALHKAYRLFFEQSETPDALIRHFAPRRVEESLRQLREAYKEDPELRLILRAYKKGRRRTYKRLMKLKELLELRQIPSWLSDPETYDWVRRFVLSGRARPMIANLLEEGAIEGIGETATALLVPMRVVYLSNAEEYWNYTDVFRANMAALPRDDFSLLLRTVSSRENDDYRYYAQSLGDALQWLAEPALRHVYYMVPRPTLHEPEDAFHFLAEPPEVGLERLRRHQAR